MIKHNPPEIPGLFTHFNGSAMANKINHNQFKMFVFKEFEDGTVLISRCKDPAQAMIGE